MIRVTSVRRQTKLAMVFPTRQPSTGTQVLDTHYRIYQDRNSHGAHVKVKIIQDQSMRTAPTSADPRQKSICLKLRYNLAHVSLDMDTTKFKDRLLGTPWLGKCRNRLNGRYETCWKRISMLMINMWSNSLLTAHGSGRILQKTRILSTLQYLFWIVSSAVQPNRRLPL